MMILFASYSSPSFFYPPTHLLSQLYSVNSVASFVWARDVQKNLIEKHCTSPSFFVATKNDLNAEEEMPNPPPSTFCRRLGLEKPVRVSILSGETNEVYSKLLASIKAKKVPSMRAKGRWVQYLVVGVVFFTLVGIVTYWRRRHKRSGTRPVKQSAPPPVFKPKPVGKGERRRGKMVRR